MHSFEPGGDPRLLFWRRVREFAVPPSMIETATARRVAGDWAGACAAARVDVDVDLRTVRRLHGRDLATQLRADLRHLAPDLLRWHLPRVAPDGLLRPGLTVALARYDSSLARYRSGGRPVHLVARTAPAWADAGQRISLALWDGAPSGGGPHPHPRPGRRFRLDLHRPLWDARHAAELGERAVTSWAAEAQLLCRADGCPGATVAVRAGARLHFALDPGSTTPRPLPGPDRTLPLLPDAATRVLPDLELLRHGLLSADRLHPLVAAALAPAPTPGAQPGDNGDRKRGRAAHTVACRGEQHRIALVGGRLTPLDHDPDEVRREDLLAQFGGTPLPCLRAIAEVTRDPAELPDIRARLAHGDVTGALAAVESLLGPAAVLPDGPLRAALDDAAARRVTYGMYRSALIHRRKVMPA